METSKMTRPEIMTALAGRDGPDCFLCKKPFLTKVVDGERVPTTPQQEMTIDHWYPQSFLFAQGKSFEEVWDLTNLRLAHKGCNAKKGDLIPVDDVTVPTRAPKAPATRAAKRAVRPEICTNCNSGRDLGPAEICGACGSGPMPAAF